jgi:hypothetical protein
MFIFGMISMDRYFLWKISGGTTWDEFCALAAQLRSKLARRRYDAIRDRLEILVGEALVAGLQNDLHAQ